MITKIKFQKSLQADLSLRVLAFPFPPFDVIARRIGNCLSPEAYPPPARFTM